MIHSQITIGGRSSISLKQFIPAFIITLIEYLENKQTDPSRSSQAIQTRE